MKPSCPSVVEAYAAPVNGGRTSPAQAFSARVQEGEGSQVALVALPPPATAAPPAAAAPLARRNVKPAKEQVEALARDLALAAKPRPKASKEVPEVQVVAVVPKPSSASKRRSTGGSSRPARSVLSHATTPSWRSRSKQVSEVDGEEADGIGPLARNRLTPLLEKRWTALERSPPIVPKSELERLEHIDPEVDEANAMLVESFLNVKRSVGSDLEAPSQRSGDPSMSSYSVSKPPMGSASGGPCNLQQATGYQVLTALPGTFHVKPLSAKETSALGSAYSCATDLSSRPC